ncbi:MAG: intein homing endonuclease-related protein [Parcubacteria group bacterium Licking1014_17]|nr:MAG: intein homing endonuclease-related protein [Parcubacteria group bacterium Licking1014_17]
MAYVLGYIFADGAVYKNPRGSWFLEFTSTDKEIIENIRKLLKSEHKISKYEKNRLNSNWKNRYRLQIGGKEIIAKLSNFGIKQNKSLSVKFPSVPAKYMSHFVRGYFDGDGCISFGKYWNKDRQKFRWRVTSLFTSGSREFLEGLKKSLKNCVKGGYINQKNRGFDLVFSLKDSLALFNLMYNNTTAETYLKRKYNKFVSALKIMNSAGVA